MIEEVIREWLNSNLKTVKAYLETPENAAREYVLIEKTSGSTEKGLSNATIITQSYSSSLHGAAALSKRVRKIMQKIIELDEATKITLNSEYNFTDTETKRYRYQAVFDIKFYEEG